MNIKESAKLFKDMYKDIKKWIDVDDELDINDFIEKMEMSKEEIDDLFAGKMPITQDIAERLENVLGVPKDYWSTLESKKLEDIQSDN